MYIFYFASIVGCSTFACAFDSLSNLSLLTVKKHLDRKTSRFFNASDLGPRSVIFAIVQCDLVHEPKY